MQAILTKLISRGESTATLPPLTPASVWDASLKADIENAAELKSQPVLRATLHLFNDDISSAHDLAQAHEESMTANLTHAILHRREQDYWNSKWWLSRIRHPLLSSIHGGVSGAKAYVDAVERCETAKRGSPTDKADLLRKQFDELLALTRHAAAEAGIKVEM